MKKLFVFAAIFAAGFAVTSCSSDKDDVVETNILDKFDAKGQAKVSFIINTAASTPESRANGENSENDNYVVGDPDEYDIKDATLIVFQGASESAATFQGAYTLSATKLGLTDTDVSDLYTATISSEGISSSSKLYALVMCNAVANGVLANPSGTTWTLNGTTLVSTGSSATKFTDFQKEALDASKLGDQTKGMLMSNAPQSAMNDTKSATAPSYSAIKTLVEITGSNIASTESSASANPVRVYVERAAAKVQVIVGSSVASPVSGTISSSDVKWITDNKEATFYTVRVAEEASGNSNSNTYRTFTSEKLASGTYSYRFFSALKESSRSDDYRIYWAIDPHYDYKSVTTESTLTTDGTVGSIATAATLDAGESNYEYITENTFNEYGLTKNRTTRVLLSIKFNGGNDFFTIDGAAGIFQTGTSATDGTLAKKVLEYVLSRADVQTWIASQATSESTTAAAVQAKISVVVTAPTAAGSMDSGIAVKYDNADNSGLTTACGDIYKGLHPICYKGGLAYYQARIKHFGDTHTPLGSPEGSTYTAIYGDPGTSGSKTAQNFLGRYSVVRNNWYVLKITAVKQIGFATIPNPDWTPDDDKNQYITTEIYVNKWAKRTQDVELD